MRRNQQSTGPGNSLPQTPQCYRRLGGLARRRDERPKRPHPLLISGWLAISLLACDSGPTPTSQGFSVLLKPDVPLVSPVAFYQILSGLEGSSLDPSANEALVISEPCELVDNDTWQCQFGAAPKAQVGALLLLLGDSSDRCSLANGVDGCVWPVAFQNTTTLTGTESKTVLTGLPVDERLPPDQLHLEWLQDGSAAQGLEVELSEPLSGMRFGGHTGEDGALEPGLDCALWDSYGCYMPPSPAWWIRTQVDADHPLEPATHWNPATASPVGVSCPDQDEDGFTLAACGLDNADCDDTNPAIYPGASEDPAQTGLGDGLDNDCDGQIDNGTRRFDDDGDGLTEEAGDCNDTDATIRPGVTDAIGDGVDQNCDGVDPLDQDNDGFIAQETLGDDCNDGDAGIHPGAIDLIGDALNQDCSQIDDQLLPYAGVGLFNGDGKPATETSLSRMKGITVDHSNRVWIADTDNLRIRMIDETLTVSTRAGDGISRYSGDGGPSTQASVAWPSIMTTGPDGSIYFVDADNRRIRRIDTSGIIQTVVGNGTSGITIDGSLAQDAQLYQVTGLAVNAQGLLYFSDSNYHRVMRVNAEGKLETVAGTYATAGYRGDNGPATAALLNNPNGLSIDSEDNLLIADTGNNRIRKVFPNGNIARIAGSGSDTFSGDGGAALDAGLSRPLAVMAMPGFTYLIADTGHERVRRVTSDNVIHPFAGNGSLDHSGDEGPATAAAISQPIALAQDTLGNVFILSSDDFRVRSVDADGIIHTYAGNGTIAYSGEGGQARDAMFYSVYDVAMDSNDQLYILDRSYGNVRRVSAEGLIEAYAGGIYWGYAGDGGPALEAAVSDANGLAVDAEDNLYIADTGNHRIRMVTPSGIIYTVAGNGVSGNQGDGGQAVNASLTGPLDVAVSRTGMLYVTDKYDHRVRAINLKTGIISTLAGTGVSGYSGDAGPATSAQLSYPLGLAVDSAGNVFIGDYGNNRIRMVQSNGIIVTVMGSGAFGTCGDGGPPLEACMVYPGYMAVDSRDNLFFGDGNRIRRLTPEGELSTVVGMASAGNGGVYGPAPEAALATPLGIAFSQEGSLFIADLENYRVVTVDP